MTKTITAMSLIVSTLLLVQAISTAYALDINYRGREGTLTEQESDEVLAILLRFYTLEEAQIIMQQMSVVDPKPNDNSITFTIRESQPGELFRCFLTIVLVNNIDEFLGSNEYIKTKGDGGEYVNTFAGELSFRGTFFNYCRFGDPSTNERTTFQQTNEILRFP